MRKTIRSLCLIAFFLFTKSMATAQDIEIKSFEHNMMSLIGSVNPETDNTGQACAVLRFFVRDTTFVIEPNMGVVKRETKLGEIRLYVPTSTKRLTVRHEGLLPLRNYVIPEPLEPKQTYDIVLLATGTKDGRKTAKPAKPVKPEPPKQKKEEKKEVVQEKPVTQRVSAVPKMPEPLPKAPKKKNDAKRSTYMTVGLGYQVMAISGPSASIGIDASHHLVELSATYGLRKTDEIFFYSDDFLLGSRQYSPFRVGLKYGYELKLSKSIGISPMIGGVCNVFNGESVRESDVRYTSYYAKASSVSITPSVRFSVSIDKLMKVNITSEYAFGVYKSDNCRMISDSDRKFKSWTDGFNVVAGISYMF